MGLTESSVAEFLAAVRSPAPVPGGGSAAALAGALGASLLTMAASLPGHRASSDADIARLQDSGSRCRGIGERLTAAIDEDSNAYGAVLSAYRLPKSSEAERSERSTRIQAALTAAAETPLAVMRATAEALRAAADVAALGNPNAASDVTVAIELLLAAARGAQSNVEANLAGIRDTAYTGGVRHQIAGILAEVEAGAGNARAQLPARL